MKIRLLLTLMGLGLLLNYSATAASATNQPVRMVIVGDSTVCNWPAKSVLRGWGMFIQDYFKTNELQVINLAKPGRSTKTFIQEGRWAAALKLKPDYVLIQFGHNDSHPPNRPEHTDAKTTYRQYLRQYIDQSRAIGAKPVLITPMSRRYFKPDGKVENRLLPYAEAMKIVAREKHVPLVDLNTASVKLWERLGPNGSNALADKPTDPTHFNAKGAEEMAHLIMQKLPTVEPSLKPCLK